MTSFFLSVGGWWLIVMVFIGGFHRLNPQQWEYDGDLVGGLEHDWIMTFHSYCECHHPNRRTHIFQRGCFTTNQLG